MKKKIGETLEAVISRVFADGIHARCVKLPVDGFVPVTTLPGDKYRFERNGQMLIGFKEGNRYRLGDQLTVRVDKVDLQDRQLYLSVGEKSLCWATPSRAVPKVGKREVSYKAKRKHERRAKKKKRRR